jgi:hypothetical protein
MKTILLSAVLVAAPSLAQAQSVTVTAPSITIEVAPPAVRVEAPPPAPSASHV